MIDIKKILECIKCFIIGDDKDLSNDIERMIYPEEQMDTDIKSEEQPIVVVIPQQVLPKDNNEAITVRSENIECEETQEEQAGELLKPEEKQVEELLKPEEEQVGELLKPEEEQHVDTISQQSISVACKEITTSGESAIGKDTYEIVCRLVDLINHLDTAKNRLKSDESVNIISFCQDKIIETITHSCGEEINNETEFSRERHFPTPYINEPPKGCKIKQVLRPGIILNNKVLLKAIVQLENISQGD